MRNEQLCINFVNGNVNIKNGNNMRISEDGKDLYSYGTCIATKLANGHFIVNATKYSCTTSKHQSYLRRALSDRIYIETSARVPMWAHDLLRYLK